MKPLLFAFTVTLFLTACEGVADLPTRISAFDEPDTQATPALVLLPAASPVIEPTVIPTETLDYQATIAAKQDEINSLILAQTGATVEHEQRIQENIRLTAQVDSWTATAALTAIPATQTQQIVNNNHVSDQATLVVNQATWTAVAPTQVILVADAQAQADTAFFRAVMAALAQPLAGLLGIVIVLCFTWIIFRRESPQAQVAPQDESQSDQRRFAKKPADAKSQFGAYITPPGDPAHFTKFVHLVLSEKKGFSKPEWETADSPYNRQTYSPVYNWLWEHGFLALKPGAKIELTSDGREWMEDWINKAFLPSPIAPESPETNLPPACFSQMPENQPPEIGGEVVEPTKEGVVA